MDGSHLCTSSWRPPGGAADRWACASWSKTSSELVGRWEKWWRNWRQKWMESVMTNWYGSRVCFRASAVLFIWLMQFCTSLLFALLVLFSQANEKFHVVKPCLIISVTLCEPVFAEAHHAAVVLVSSSLVQHARVDDVSDRHVQVIGTQALQQPQGLIACGLKHTHHSQKSWGLEASQMMHRTKRLKGSFFSQSGLNGLTVSSNLVKEDMSMTHTASLQHFTSAPTISNQSGL